MSTSRVAIVHERFTEFGGSELVVAEFMKTWPQAKVFAPITEPHCRRQVMHAAGRTEGAPHEPISGTWLDDAYALTGRRSHAPLLPLVPGALGKLPLGDDVDAVLISHHSFATQAVFATEAPVVAYVHSPARWAWDRTFRDHEIASRAGRIALSALGKLARRGELRAAPRLSHVIANSHAVAERIRDWWGLPSTVISPPVRIDRFSPDLSIRREDFYLCAGRLVPYKRADLAIRAAQRANCRLVVLGEGRFREHLEDIAGPETTFLGAASDDVLLDMYRRCRALLMPGVEDFGIVPVEAMACGTPVLALGEGGALDTVTPGITGEHMRAGPDDAVVEQLAALMRDFDPADYDAGTIRARACEFSPEAFRARIAETVQGAVRA
ncbi:Probable glycosyl transferase [Mycobacteroides abscessus subsp. abscessus]|uniref:Glycosyl transferases group 1 family protein n=2 Tax=Mycobacteroides abscessus TaxID=36809 RepID=A0A829Q0T7_9MYCO|nr:glycosyltransferase [Mycobacteroides abscessus]EUA45917.1 glycosyl transferases group 1 family protein [Mycobacteroides abscessus 21]EIC68055.1 glycosyl transferase [Mycobacteroides abscessus M94]EIU00338.1 glycosyl transferase, group 1 family protein [Mycobacteroides abscessus 4S-0726-RA]EIU00491.1 glycosyl transferase, group 1 family protein [Mycobacteroides abscessus 4S-0303]EIU01835.1 glycosyl transferase, group 1 family protein [Mycobacteroides abscessus 4S-0726-RB]